MRTQDSFNSIPEFLSTLFSFVVFHCLLNWLLLLEMIEKYAFSGLQ